MIGRTILQYEILEKLGEGGMGIVYKARDTRLDRFAALKFLPARAAQTDQEKSRFMQEARSASALNHPNVCTIYGIGEYEGGQFIEMELVDGVTLREKSAASTLPVRQVVDYAVQIAEALQEAHSKGIVHRDVKAENIMVNSRNQIKVMDFGLAKLKGSLKLTKSSSTIGTIAYMSPEQIRGVEADIRSDIFSFGVVLFEMATAKMPFRGEHEAAIMYSIVNEEPEDAARLREDLPQGLLHILSKSLEKDPDDRYQSMAEVIVDLRRLKKESARIVRTQEFTRPDLTGSRSVAAEVPPPARKRFPMKYAAGLGVALAVVVSVFLFKAFFTTNHSAPSGKKVIVVLPFENLGPADKDYFVEGMSDEVTSRLSGLSGLSVIARSSATQYKKTTKTLKQIGEELGVSYILQGTVRWETSGGETHVRVNPTLIKVDDGTQAWSQSMESVLSSAFKLQADIASRVASAMDVALAKTERKSLETSLTENPEAYDYYLQAILYSDRRGVAKSDFEIASQLLEKAIRIDPSFAAAYAKLSIIQSNFYWFYFDHTESRIEQSRVAADKAVGLSPQLSEPHEARGWYLYHAKLDYAGALDEFALALKYRPSNSDVYAGIAAVLRRQGKMPESVEAYRKSITGNPRAADIVRQLAETHTLLREYEEAERIYDRAIELSPDVTWMYWEKIKNLILWKGDIGGARRIMEESRRLGQSDRADELPQHISYAVELLDGNFSAAQQALDRSSTGHLVNSQFEYAPTSLLRAYLEAARGNESGARKYFDTSRAELEKKKRETPDDARVRSALGIAYAGVGRNDEALKEGLRGVELLPVEKEAWRGTSRLYDLARIYMMVGNLEKAVDVLEHLLSISSEVSVPLLRLEPWWKPLRANARFQKLVAQ